MKKITLNNLKSVFSGVKSMVSDKRLIWSDDYLTDGYVMFHNDYLDQNLITYLNSQKNETVIQGRMFMKDCVRCGNLRPDRFDASAEKTDYVVSIKFMQNGKEKFLYTIVYKVLHRTGIKMAFMCLKSYKAISKVLNIDSLNCKYQGTIESDLFNRSHLWTRDRKFTTSLWLPKEWSNEYQKIYDELMEN